MKLGKPRELVPITISNHQADILMEAGLARDSVKKCVNIAAAPIVLTAIDTESRERVCRCLENIPVMGPICDSCDSSEAESAGTEQQREALDKLARQMTT